VEPVLPIGLGLGAAASIGVGSFAVGIASRRLPPAVIGFWNQAVGGVLCALLLIILQPPLAAGQAPWGLVAGLAGGMGSYLLYRAMSLGAISLVAPITACSVVIPVAYSILAGELPTALVAAGILAMIAGVVITSLQPMPVPGDPTDLGLAKDRQAVAYAVCAALAFGIFFVLVDFAPQASGWSTLWTAGAVRVTGFGVQAVLLLLSRTRLVAPGRVTPLIVISGALDLTSLILIGLGAATDAYGLVTALVGLYPVITTLLGVILLGERLTRIQTGGAMLAMTGVMLVSI
jgi:drug/metabolite transporter (DMT)-like permease